MSHTNAPILSHVGSADSIAGKRSRFVLGSGVSASGFVGSKDGIAKQVGPEVCFVRSEDDIAKQVGWEAEQLGSEGKHEVVESADGTTKQVGSRWKRTANGKGKGQVKRDRDSSSGRGACRKSEFMAKHTRQMKIMTKIETKPVT